MSNFRRRSPKRRLYSFDRQYAAERRPREYPAVQKTDDVSRAASGDQCSFAHAFDAPCQQERQQRGNRYERDVESDFEFSEIRIIAPRGVVDESFGATAVRSPLRSSAAADVASGPC